MQVTPQERRQVFWTLLAAGLLFAVFTTIFSWVTSDLSFVACIAIGVVAGTIFAPALHLGLKAVGLYAPKGKARHSCDACGQPLPIFRRPTSFRQAMYGGWTCPNCGAELDRHDRPIRSAEGRPERRGHFPGN